MATDDVRTQGSSVGHLPLIRAVMDQLGIVEVVDRLCPKHEQSRVSDADCVAAMVLNILSGRTALYAMEEWLGSTDTELLVGEGCAPDAFNDTRLALTLDHLDAVGTDAIMGGVVEAYLATEGRPTEYSVHTDTTSFSLYGAYADRGDPEVTYGYSKDKRPDLKQLIFGLSLHGSVGIPLVSDVVAGNTSDHEVNRDVLKRLGELLPDSDDVTVVADCKAVDATTLGRVLDEGLHIVSLVPDTFSARRRFIEAAWEACPDVTEWPELARAPGRLKADPDRVYRGWSTTEPFTVRRRSKDAGDDTLVETVAEMRLLVVHSAKKEERFDRSLPGKLNREKKRLDDFVKRAAKKEFACEADARSAAAEGVGRVRLHDVDVEVWREEVTLKHARRGRPRQGEEAPTKTVWRIGLTSRPDDEAIERARQRKSCFLLISDHTDEEAWPDQRILSEYRHQYLVENHTGFRWLKSEAAVSPMFLKTPRRIRAMGLVLVLALMVRNYIQFTLRAELRGRDETLPHPFTKKEVNNLTTEMAMNHFMGVSSIQVSIEGGPFRRTAPKLSQPALRILELLKVPRSCFTTPPSRLGRSPPGK